MFNSRNELISYAVRECLELLYKYSVPSMSFNELEKTVKDGGEYDINFFAHHYIPKDLQDEIVDRIKYVYGIENYFSEYTGILKDYLLNGGLKDKYVEDEYGLSHRDYENTAKLSDVIGEENAKKVEELIDECRSFYRIDQWNSHNFEYSVFNYSPSNFKTNAEKYWKEKGFDYSFDDEEIKNRYYKEEYGDSDYENLNEDNNDISEC